MNLKPEHLTALHGHRSVMGMDLLTKIGPLVEEGIAPTEDIATVAYVLWLARWTTQHGPLLSGRFPSEQWALVASRARQFNTAPTLLDFCHALWGSHKSGLGVPFASLREDDALWLRVQSKRMETAWKSVRSLKNLNEAVTYARFLDEMMKEVRNSQKLEEIPDAP